MKNIFILCAVIMFTVFNFPYAAADTRDDEIQALKAQVQDLMGRIGKLEKEQVEEKSLPVKKEEEVKKAESRIDLANASSKLKIKGRVAAGFFDSGKAGFYPSGSFEVPDAKIQFNFAPDDINTVVLRLNLNNNSISSTNPLADYLFLQSKDFISGLKDSPFSLSSRLGRFKLGFGDEDLSNNLIDSVLPSNSAANLSAVDEGIEFSGKIKLEKLNLRPLGWVVSVSDGTNAVGSDSGSAKAFMGKFIFSPVEPLSLSVSYYDSGDLKNSQAELKVAGLQAVPSGAVGWQRTAWEVDARYDFDKGKKWSDAPLFSDAKAIVRLSYGGFGDDVSAGSERTGNFGFAEGLYNLNKKVYAAGRFSFVDLSGDATASLNNVTCNDYQRYSLGMGYHFSENTLLKLAYDWNKESGVSISDTSNDLFSLVAATQF